MKTKLWLFFVGASFSYSLIILFHSSLDHATQFNGDDFNSHLPLYHHHGTQIHVVALNSEEASSSGMMRSRFGHEVPIIESMGVARKRLRSPLGGRNFKFLGGHESSSTPTAECDTKQQPETEKPLNVPNDSSVIINDTYHPCKMTFLEDDISEKGDSSSFKNKLQELTQRKLFGKQTQRKHIGKPTYRTTQSGSPHKPTFFSIVEVESKEFHGKEAKSKKEAEQNAAKVAYLALKEYVLKEVELEEISSANVKVSSNEQYNASSSQPR